MIVKERRAAIRAAENQPARLITPLVEQLGPHSQQKQGPQHSPGKDLRKYDGYECIGRLCHILQLYDRGNKECHQPPKHAGQQTPAITYTMKVWESGIDLCLQKCSIMGKHQRERMYISGYLSSTSIRFLIPKNL